jgi:hypothetical protein
MAVELGIVGLPNVGKSTLFNALTRAHATVAPYPFTTIEPNVGVVSVPDTRLQRIAEIVQPEKVVPSSLRVVDIAGLVKGASRGEGLGNQFLGHIRTVDAVAMVVRAFQDPDIPHVSADLNPLQDIDTVRLELSLADLSAVERRREKTTTASKAKPAEFAAELQALGNLHARLDAGQPARGADLTPHESALAAELGLLTAKPMLYVVNVGEDDLPLGGSLAQAVRQRVNTEGAELVVICAHCEAELSEWPESDAASYRRELGVEAPGLERFIAAGYRLLNLITFFTITGGKEARAWPLPQGTSVLEAAGRIHTDMQHGFIRAEVVGYDDLSAAGSMAVARDKGHLHIEGRDYLVRDGDVIHIRFNV